MEQRIIKEALKNPEIYPKDELGRKNIKVIETHISWVFLTGKFAYKVKKAVNFGFVDFTTVKKRRFYCEEELRLNSRLSPEIYLGIVPISMNEKEEINLASKGKIIEYALKMKELPQQSIMKNKLTKDEVSFHLIDNIAKKIAHFHEQLPIDEKEAKEYGSFSTIKYNWEEHFYQSRPFLSSLFQKKFFYRIREIIGKSLEENKELFEKRIKEGRVKRCHGDLHSANIFVLNDDEFYIFDCIEFNLRFAYSDVANEVAFLSMDLDFHDRPDLSDFFVWKYSTYAKDFELLRLLDFYKCYRAYVRAKVAAFSWQNIKDKKKREEQRELAQRYLKLAYTYANSLPLKKRIIVMMGLPGSGKTYIGRRIRKELNFTHFTTDLIRKDIAGLYPEEDSASAYGENIYSAYMTRRTYEELFKRAALLLNKKRSCILDGTFLTQFLREKLKDWIKKQRIKEENFYPIFCYAPEWLILRRLKKKKKDTISFSEATPEVYFKMKAQFTPPTKEEFQPYELTSINTTKGKKILAMLISKIRKTS
jgi:aminoglycoside phosphotransferase family enzyme/predicted kinase